MQKWDWLGGIVREREKGERNNPFTFWGRGDKFYRSDNQILYEWTVSEGAYAKILLFPQVLNKSWDTDRH